MVSMWSTATSKIIAEAFRAIFDSLLMTQIGVYTLYFNSLNYDHPKSTYGPHFSCLKFTVLRSLAKMKTIFTWSMVSRIKNIPVLPVLLNPWCLDICLRKNMLTNKCRFEYRTGQIGSSGPQWQLSEQFGSPDRNKSPYFYVTSERA